MYNQLLSVLLEIAATAASCAAYKNWSDDFCRKEINEAIENLDAPLRRQRDFKVIMADLRAMTKEQQASLGIRNWNDKLQLIPLWMFHYLADGETLTSIAGDTVVTGNANHIDLDHRGGSLAYGFL